MKKVILLCGALLALTAVVAQAGPGTNLRWNACLGDGGVPNRAFACNVKIVSAPPSMVADFALPEDGGQRPEPRLESTLSISLSMSRL